MEEEHVHAAQKWDYKKECLHQERQRLLETSMKAMGKVVNVDNASRVSSLVHNTPYVDSTMPIKHPDPRHQARAATPAA